MTARREVNHGKNSNSYAVIKDPGHTHICPTCCKRWYEGHKRFGERELNLTRCKKCLAQKLTIKEEFLLTGRQRTNRKREKESGLI